MNSDKIIIGVIVAITVGIFGFIAYTSFTTPHTSTTSDLNAEDIIGTNPHVKGAPIDQAKVVVVEFSDFECPYCAQSAGEVTAMLAANPEVAFVYRHFPLSMHPNAQISARASEAANKQGKFWEMHDELFAGQSELSRERILEMAKTLGLNEDQFKNELDSSEMVDAVKADSDKAKELNLSGTPTFYIIKDGKVEKLSLTTNTSLSDEVQQRLNATE